MIYQTLGEENAAYKANRIENDEEIYGIAIVYVDEEKAYLIQRFETDDFTDGVPAMAYYVAVYTDSVHYLN